MLLSTWLSTYLLMCFYLLLRSILFIQDSFLLESVGACFQRLWEPNEALVEPIPSPKFDSNSSEVNMSPNIIPAILALFFVLYDFLVILKQFNNHSLLVEIYTPSAIQHLEKHKSLNHSNQEWFKKGSVSLQWYSWPSHTTTKTKWKQIMTH